MLSASSGKFFTMLTIIFFCFTSTHTALSAFSDIDLNGFTTGSEGYKVIGAATNARLGSDNKAIGDFNGDGLDDIVVNSWNLNQLYVIFGRAGIIEDMVDMANFVSSENKGIIVLGETGGDRFSEYVNAAGDVNGDGYDDIVVGASYGAPEGNIAAGTAYVIFGRPNSQGVVDILSGSLSSTSGYRIFGPSANAFCGRAVSGAGDINGDGFDDVAIGCYGIATVFVIFGKRSGFTDMDLSGLSSDSRGFSITGVANSHLGMAVNPAGDFNHDGYDDLFIGAPWQAYSGRSYSGAGYVMFGHTNTTSFPALTDADITSGTGGFAIYGAADNYFCGNPGGGFIGDFNNDGVDDIAFPCSYQTALGRDSAGAVYVLFGNPFTTSFLAVDLASFTSSSSRGFRIWGGAADDNLGMSLGSAGDVNGDGISDVIIGAQNTDPFGRIDAGTAYVLFGRRNTTAAFTDLDLASFTTGATTGFRMFGAAENDYISRSVASAGDINGDGVDDLLVGSDSPGEPGRSGCGNVYVIYGVRNPTAAPSASPTSQPTMDPYYITKVRTSPTYRVHNGFAFAVTSANGTVHTWGEAPHGGDSFAVHAHMAANVTKVVPARFAYAALKNDGSVVPWGAADTIHGLDAYPPGSYVLSELIANEAAFAGVDAGAGRVIAFGSRHTGGNVLSDATCNGYVQQLMANIKALAASTGAFAALSSDGSVYAWGNKHVGGGVSREFLASLPTIQLIVATRSSFAVVSLSGRVYAWGDALSGGDTSSVTAQLASGVVHIIASRSAFAALKSDTSLVVWGYGETGGDASAVAAELSANVTFVAHTYLAMAALKTDGTVVTWGRLDGGGNSSAVQAQLRDVEWVYGNSKAFAALTAAGRVVAWGKAAYGGQIPFSKVSALSSGVVSIYHTNRAFAALKSDGSVVVWGQPGHGGSPGAAVEAHLVSGVHTICSNDAAFSAIKTDGSVVGWGHPVSIPTTGVQLHSSEMTVGVECS